MSKVDYDLFVAASDHLGKMLELWKLIVSTRSEIEDLKEALKEAKEELRDYEAKFSQLMCSLEQKQHADNETKPR